MHPSHMEEELNHHRRSITKDYFFISSPIPDFEDMEDSSPYSMKSEWKIDQTEIEQL